MNQFIPSNMSWRGWVKMAFHQPLIPVIPVARELISKTKWIASSKGSTSSELEGPLPRQPRRITGTTEPAPPTRQRTWRRIPLRRKLENPPINITAAPLTVEPASVGDEEPAANPPRSRHRVMSLFHRSSPRLRQREHSPNVSDKPTEHFCLI